AASLDRRRRGCFIPRVTLGERAPSTRGPTVSLQPLPSGVRPGVSLRSLPSGVRPAAKRWARERAPLLGASAALALALGVCRGRAPGRDLDALAVVLGRRAHGGNVAPAEVRWGPSGGAVADALLGRWALFLSRAPGEDARDVWRARVRVSPEGSA